MVMRGNKQPFCIQPSSYTLVEPTSDKAKLRRFCDTATMRENVSKKQKKYLILTANKALKIATPFCS